MRSARRTPAALLAAGLALAACGGPRPIERTEALGGPVLRRVGGTPKVVRERAAEVRLVPLDFAGVALLRMERFDGDVHLEAIERGRPELRAHLRTVAGERALAARTLESIRILTERDGDALVLRLERPDLTKPYLTSSSYDLLVPAGVRVRIVNESGDVDVRGAFSSVSLGTTSGDAMVVGTRGDVAVSSESGNLLIERVEAREVSAVTTFGAVTLRDVRAERAEGRSRSGDVRLERVRAERSTAGSSHGLVEAVELGGSARFTTLESELAYEARHAGGSVALRSGRGEVGCHGGEGALAIRSESGRVAVEDFTGSVVVTSHHGLVELSGVLEEVRAESGSGRLVVRALEGSRAAADWRLSTDFGNLILSLPASFACRLEAIAERGTIRSDFPIELDAEEADGGLAGLLNGGGRGVRLRSSSGRIEIRRGGGG